MTTLLALFRRPEGGPDAVAAFERAYAETHLPLVVETPGLRTICCDRVVDGLVGGGDLCLVTTMTFDDRAALDAGLASDAMRAGGRNLREIAQGLFTLVVLESAETLVPDGWR